MGLGVGRANWGTSCARSCSIKLLRSVAKRAPTEANEAPPRDFWALGWSDGSEKRWRMRALGDSASQLQGVRGEGRE
eukprot:314447-Prymnesium_polylepis.1